MTSYGKINLLAMTGMPVAACLAAAITPALEKPYTATFVSIFVMNLIPMLIGGIVAALLLRGAKKSGGTGAGLALSPSLITGVVGAVWYLWRAIVPDPIAPGVEYIIAPQYLVIGVIALSAIAWVGCRVVRARKAPH